MNIAEIKETTDQARSYNEWFESEWSRNGVGGLIQHNDQLIANVKYLLSIIEQAEKALQSSVQQMRNDGEEFALEIGCRYEDSEIVSLALEVLQAIKGE